MALSKEEKLAAIDAARGPLEHEHYAATLAVKVADEGRDSALAEEPKARLAELDAKLKALDAEEAKLK